MTRLQGAPGITDPIPWSSMGSDDMAAHQERNDRRELVGLRWHMAESDPWYRTPWAAAELTDAEAEALIAPDWDEVEEWGDVIPLRPVRHTPTGEWSDYTDFDDNYQLGRLTLEVPKGSWDRCACGHVVADHDEHGCTVVVAKEYREPWLPGRGARAQCRCSALATRVVSFEELDADTRHPEDRRRYTR